ncbi:hypothetical protein L0Z72_00985 [candidate division KSB1 bacterium]|nr:hypothetical protein [candidate division KSB1 bacterium]
MLKTVIIFMIFTSALPIVAAADEIERMPSLPILSVATGFAYQNWLFSNTGNSLSQLTFPVSISVPAGEKAGFSLRTFQTNNHFGTDKLAGVSDIKLQGKTLLFADRLLFSTGVNLPSGKNKLNQQEFTISSITAMPFLKMTVPHLGGGFDLNLSLSAAEKISSMTLGLGIGYQRKGAFEPFHETAVQYDPGDEFYLEFGFESGRKHKLIFDAIFTHFQRDLYDETEIFKSGNRWRVHLMYQFADWAFMEQKRLIQLYLIYRTRTNNEYLTIDGFVPEENRIYRDMGTMGFQGRFPLSPKIALNFSSQLDIQEIVLDKSYPAFVGGGSAGASFQLNSQFSINFNAELYRGLMKNGFEAVWFTGWRFISGLGYTL